jgi:anaerobic ribonucleoside-triphosphate reductase
MASTLQSHYAGAIGWEAVNMFFAPYLVGLSYDRIKQLAQMLIYEFNQLAGARGSQVVFTDFNLYWNIPSHFREAPAIGPGGEYTGRVYGDYEIEAQTFLKALFEVYLEGDAMGKTFVFPKPLLHINEDFFNTVGHEEFLDLACKVASRQGITYFVFDRGDEVTISQCCRVKLRLSEEDLKEISTPEKMRFTALQNITINLPRIAYKANGSDEILFEELEKAMQMVAEAHMQKRAFISSLLEQGENGPLSVLCDNKDGEPYLRLERLTYLSGLLGLNEMVQYHVGQELHQSQEALKFGLRVVAHMNLLCKRLSEKYGVNLVLEESPAESSAYRLAKLDMKYYPAQAVEVLKGDLDSDEFYYTNSVHLNVEADIDYIERVQKQSLFHPLIEAGAICHVWLGEHEPDPESIRSFVIKTFQNTRSSQIAFSPEFTVCNDCRRTSRGLHPSCPICGSENVYGITRIVGYYSKVTTWNKGKVGELKDRVKTDLKGGFGNAALKSIREAGLSKVSGG